MYFRKAQEKDLNFLIETRNDPVSAKYSKRGILDKKTVFQDYLANKNKQTYIAMVDKQNVGYLAFEQIKLGSYEISLALNPSFRGKGLGSKLLIEGTKFGFNTLEAKQIVAKVFSENIKSKYLFEKAGYQLIEEKKEPLTFIKQLS